MVRELNRSILSLPLPPGFHYPINSLKTDFCLRGRELLYHKCSEWGIPHSQIGKLTVGDSTSHQKLLDLERHSHSLGPLAPPVKFLSEEEIRELEPDLGSNIKYGLLSPRTGIVSSHQLLESLEREILDSENAELVYGTKVVRVNPNLPNVVGGGNGKRGMDSSQEGWVVETQTGEEGQTDSILARVLINSSGLNGPLILNSLMDEKVFGKDSKEEGKIGMHYSKGNYATYRGEGTKNIKRLIYPMPFGAKKEGGSHVFQGLGSEFLAIENERIDLLELFLTLVSFSPPLLPPAHLTLDLDGNVKFGPDTEWLSPPPSEDLSSPELIDYWKHHLSVSDQVLSSMCSSIQLYLPRVSLSGLSPDYSGIRPKLIGPDSKKFRDFEILFHTSRDLASQKLWQRAFPNGMEWSNKDPSNGIEKLKPKLNTDGKETDLPMSLQIKVLAPMISLLGIESPGLTSSLAIGESVAELVGRTVWGNEGRRSNRGKTASGRMRDDGAEIEGWA